MLSLCHEILSNVSEFKKVSRLDVDPVIWNTGSANKNLGECGKKVLTDELKLLKSYLGVCGVNTLTCVAVITVCVCVHVCCVCLSVCSV